MEKFLLRALVLVLAGVAVGVFFYSRSTVRPQMDAVVQPPVVIPTGGPAGSTAQTGASPATGAPAATGSPAMTGSPPPTVATSNATKESYFITLEQAKALHDKGDAIFIDARPYVEFTEGHIRGAMHVDKKYFDGAAPKKVRDYLPGKEVVIYCHGAECTDSEAVVIRLQALHLGIGPYRIIKDGYPGWEGKNKADAQGYPIDKGGEVGFE